MCKERLSDTMRIVKLREELNSIRHKLAVCTNHAGNELSAMVYVYMTKDIDRVLEETDV